MRKQIFILTCGIIMKLVNVPTFCSGQLMTNNNVAIKINAAQITVKGDVQNNTGTTIDNSGTIDMTGNWVNNSGGNCFGTSTGTVILNGVNQNIGGSNSTVFNNLYIQGGGTTTLLVNTTVGGGNITPAGTLGLNSGVMDLNSKTLFITNPLTSGITSVTGSIKSEMADNSSKVDWNMQNSGGSHTIPFSNAAGTIIPFNYDLISGTHGHVVLSTYATNNSNMPYPIAPNLVTSISTLGDGTTAKMVHRFWEVDVENTGVLSSLTFTFDPVTEAPSGTGNLYLQRWDNTSAWDIPAPGQALLFPNSLRINNNNKYGTFGMAKGASPLPVSLISFDAKLNSSKQVDINWVTASEINNDYFSVQRSSDARTFETIKNVDGAGNSSMILKYYCQDKNPIKGISYYRLKQTDYNGTTSYSEIAVVNNSDMGSVDVSIYPNPVTDYAIISVSSLVKNAGEIVFELYDMAGKKVMSKKLIGLNAPGENIFRFEKDNLLPGTYLYRAILNSETMGQGKLVIR